MSHRPLVLVGGLTAGDYLLWNWSLNSNHEVLALVSGLTLPPLAVACVWLLALNVARLIARSTRGRAERLARRAVLRQEAAREPLAGAGTEEIPAPVSSAGGRSGRLAA